MTVKLTVQNRQAKVLVVPSMAALVIKALKEPERDQIKYKEYLGTRLVMASLGQQLPHAYQAIKVEAIVACKAVEFGREIGVAKVIVEGDSAIVVKALCSSDKGLASYGWLVKDTALYSGFFSESSHSHTRREGNRVAHGLAR
ncbi:hypothetical protein SO802_001978 [Lithocarpus litseifolius]|uniref:RNase H type-1 domain-containing protein n=1 Tax=Lithocarpus litseifolius TaxID=425828 RepID=A0AAW2DXT9_9ROSI